MPIRYVASAWSSIHIDGRDIYVLLVINEQSDCCHSVSIDVGYGFLNSTMLNNSIIVLKFEKLSDWCRIF